MGFSAYGITQGDDPMSHAMKGLIDNASGHEHQIALLWQAITQLSEFVGQEPETAVEMPDALLRLAELRWEEARVRYVEEYEAWQKASISFVVQPLTFYERNPVWTEDPKSTPFKYTCNRHELTV
mgnify:CR=1 FL=1